MLFNSSKTSGSQSPVRQQRMHVSSVSQINYHENFHPLGHTPLPLMSKGSSITASVPNLVTTVVSSKGQSPYREWAATGTDKSSSVRPQHRSLQKMKSIVKDPGQEQFTWKTTTSTDVGWKMNSLTNINLKFDDSQEVLNKDINKFCMPKPCMRSFDKAKQQRFVYQQDGFSAALDKKLGFEYSDKFCIR